MAVLSHWKPNDDAELTRFIVMGYIRDVEKTLPSNAIYKTTEYIIYTILSFLINIFNNNGIYTWNIHQYEVVQQILNAKTGKRFESEDFIMSRLKWKLEAYPNGTEQDMLCENKGWFVIRLRLLYLPSIVSKCQFGAILRMKENGTGSCWMAVLSKGEYLDLTICPLSQLKTFATITIQCEIDIFKLILREYMEYIEYPTDDIVETMPRKQQFVVRIDRKQMDEFRYYANGMAICSDIYNGIWCLQYYPNGRRLDDIGYLSMYLQIYSMAMNKKLLRVQYRIKCIENGEILRGNVEFTHSKCRSNGGDKWMKLEDLVDFNCIDFDVKLSVFWDEADDNKCHIRDNVQIASILSD